MLVEINLDEIVNTIIEMNDAPQNTFIELDCGLKIFSWKVKDINALNCGNDSDIINLYINRSEKINSE